MKGLVKIPSTFSACCLRKIQEKKIDHELEDWMLPGRYTIAHSFDEMVDDVMSNWGYKNDMSELAGNWLSGYSYNIYSEKDYTLLNKREEMLSKEMRLIIEECGCIEQSKDFF